MLSDAMKKWGRRQPDHAGMDASASFYAAWGKRLLDVTGALVLIAVFAPLIMLLSAGLSWQRGPVLFGHRRIGRDGQPFTCLKFRTMVPDADRRLAELLAQDPGARREWESSRKLADDPRITGIGSFLRKTSLDELPQLLNVLRGEMSLVGPRPVPEAELDLYGPAREAYMSVRPGLTGRWQVSGRNDISYAARVAMDEAYARELTLAGDLAIIARTALVVLGATGK
ncbi:sugar transferase [Paracoccus siganidrum]|uniref:Sugar transferase n=2 Tax=Paracoccus siganidrum TaxID=1276757 RepID=A0A419AA14_9RHOB|nr:sugar transferase [Paracoccus siganidrum]RJL19331.1 sugar transferase [Paracoccus siganidrum]RMC33094.1 sugar transferase [Paracoccus siganidrum]